MVMMWFYALSDTCQIPARYMFEWGKNRRWGLHPGPGCRMQGLEIALFKRSILNARPGWIPGPVTKKREKYKKRQPDFRTIPLPKNR